MIIVIACCMLIYRRDSFLLLNVVVPAFACIPLRRIFLLALVNNIKRFPWTISWNSYLSYKWSFLDIWNVSKLFKSTFKMKICITLHALHECLWNPIHENWGSFVLRSWTTYLHYYMILKKNKRCFAEHVYIFHKTIILFWISKPQMVLTTFYWLESAIYIIL